VCGICGYINNNNLGAKRNNILEQMTGTLIHRGPDEDGLYVDKTAALGMRRLKIIDLSTGSQPIFNEDKSIVTVFNGEIYNYRDIRKDLEKSGHSFYTNTDTEVIVHAYEAYGEECVNKFNGMFAIALWDIKAQKLILFRDRLGIKPLYYCQIKNDLIFGSEIKAILKYPGLKADIDNEMAAAYFALRYVPAPWSIYKQIQKVLPGTMLIWKNGDIKQKKYWRISFTGKNYYPFEKAVEKFEELFSQSVQRRMVSDVPLGGFLSGGIDSSLVAREMRLHSTNVNTFNVKFGPGYFDETAYAIMAAKAIGTNHEVLNLGMNLEEILPKIAYYFDEPFADPAALPAFGMSQKAREKVTVVLTGDGGDEVFGGYERYISELWAQKVRLLPAYLRNGIIKKALDILRLSGLARNRTRHLLERSLLKMERLNLQPDQRYIQHFYTFTWAEQQKLWHKDALPENDRVKDYFTQTLNEGGSDFLNKRFFLDLNTWLPDQMLVKIDRMTMAHGLEARVPFLDHELVEFACGLPSQYKTGFFVLKKLLRHAAAGVLPEKITKRPKHGFAVPLDNLLRTTWKEIFHNTMNTCQSKNNNLFNFRYVNIIFQEHLKGYYNHGDKLYSLLMWFFSNCCLHYEA